MNGMAETWLAATIEKNQSFLDGYQTVQTPEGRDHSIRRASEGIIVPIRTEFKLLEIIRNTNLRIIVEIHRGNFNFIVGVMYWKPELDSEFIMGMISVSIRNLSVIVNSVPCLIGGDFNSGVEEPNQLDHPITEHCTSNSHRVSSDNVVNYRGRLLSDIMESECFFCWLMVGQRGTRRLVQHL